MAVLLKEVNEVAPFAGFIAEEESDVRRSTHALIQSTVPADRQGQTESTSKCRPSWWESSFGMVSDLLEQPCPCGVVMATEAQVGVIRADSTRGANSSLYKSSRVKRFSSDLLPQYLAKCPSE
ncbi:unnamed protein product [Boreogadus saida]